jgi:hypothetical protein
MSQGFMTVAELATHRVPEDPASPVPTEGYILIFVTLYVRGFSLPSHEFL